MRNRHSNRRKSLPSRSEESVIPLVINFVSAPTTCVPSLAILKYDKDFAHSFTLDDSLISALTSGLPVLSGGTAGDGLTYQPLYYTDGCGNNKLFRAAIAFYAVNSSGLDLHINTPSNLTYAQLNTLKDSGWNIISHSWSHANGSGNTPGYPGVGKPTYSVEIDNNRTTLINNIGEYWPHFIIPSGDLNYDAVATTSGIKCIYNQAGTQYLGGNGGLQIDGIGFESPMRIFRVSRQETDTYPTVKSNIDTVASKAINGAKFIFNDFTHTLTTSLLAGGMTIADFASYMGYVASTYGASGTDRVWMAPLQDVWEYVNLRENTRIDTPLIYGNYAVSALYHTVSNSDSKTFGWTIKINSDQNISSINPISGYNITFRGTGSNKIINIDKI